MGVFSDDLKREVRLERMRPGEIERAIAERPAAYVPFGSIEWHGRQNAVGLDAIKAHEQLVGLAARAGGVVYPAQFWGSGGGHGDYAHSFMFDPAPVRALLVELLRHLEGDGFRAAVLLSGHYPNKGEYIDPAVEAYRDGGGGMEILSLIEWEAPEAGGDHAARWETSYQLFLHPETVDMAELDGAPADEGTTGPEESVDWMGDTFKEHPCYGILGADPRAHASADLGRRGTEGLIAFLAEWLGRVSP